MCHRAEDSCRDRQVALRVSDMASQKSIQSSPRRSPRQSTALPSSSIPAASTDLPKSIEAKTASPGTPIKPASPKPANIPARRQTVRHLQPAAAALQVTTASVQSAASLSAGNSSEDASGGQYAKLRSLPGRSPRASGVTKSPVAKLSSASSTDFRRPQKTAQSRQKELAKLSLAGSTKQAEPVKHEASSKPPGSAADVTAAMTASTAGDGSSPDLAAPPTADTSMAVSATQAATPQSSFNPPAQSEAILVPQLSKSALVTVNGSPVEDASTINVSQIPRAASPGFPEEASMPKAARVFSGGYPALTQATEASCSFSVSFPVTALVPPAATLHTSLPASNTAAKATPAVSNLGDSAAPGTPTQSVAVSMAPHIPSTAPETTAVQLRMFVPRSAVVSQQVMKSTVIAAGPRAANDRSHKGQMPATAVIKSEHPQSPDRSMEQLGGVPHFFHLGTKSTLVPGRPIRQGAGATPSTSCSFLHAMHSKLALPTDLHPHAMEDDSGPEAMEHHSDTHDTNLPQALPCHHTMLLQVKPNVLLVTAHVDLALFQILVRVCSHAVLPLPLPMPLPLPLCPGSNQRHCSRNEEKHCRVRTNMSARMELPAVNMLATNNM